MRHIPLFSSALSKFEIAGSLLALSLIMLLGLGSRANKPYMVAAFLVYRSVKFNDLAFGASALDSRLK